MCKNHSSKIIENFSNFETEILISCSYLQYDAGTVARSRTDNFGRRNAVRGSVRRKLSIVSIFCGNLDFARRNAVRVGNWVSSSEMTYMVSVEVFNSTNSLARQKMTDANCTRLENERRPAARNDATAGRRGWKRRNNNKLQAGGMMASIEMCWPHVIPVGANVRFIGAMLS